MKSIKVTEKAQGALKIFSAKTKGNMSDIASIAILNHLAVADYCEKNNCTVKELVLAHKQMRFPKG